MEVLDERLDESIGTNMFHWNLIDDKVHNTLLEFNRQQSKMIEKYSAGI